MKQRRSSNICQFCADTVCQSKKLWDYHHGSWDDLGKSAYQECIFCSGLLLRIKDSVPEPQNLDWPVYRWNIRRDTRIREQQEIISVIFRPLVKSYPDCANEKGGLLADMVFHFYHEKDLVGIRDVSELGQRTDSEKSWTQMRKWIDECTNGHELHNKCQRPKKSDPFYPTRLLDISGIDANTKSGTIRLIDTAEDKPKGNYVTLSHKWGSYAFVTPSAEGTEELRRGVVMTDHRFTLNFQEAIQTARRIGVDYIWIDSMCILQHTSDDFPKEAPRMHDYYQHSYCNIAASDAAEPGNGLYRPRVSENKYPIWIGKYVPTGTERILNHGVWVVISSQVWEEQLLQNPLYTRGWVFQERLLAPRVLHFSRNQVFFECASISACEILPTGIPRMSGTRAAIDRHWRERLQYRFQKDSTQLAGTKDLSVEEFWGTAVGTYSRCELTRGTDKIIAIQGVATLVEEIIGQSQPRRTQTYRDGLWSENLEEQLVWRVIDCRQGTGKPSDRPRPLRFPSWTWASVDGIIEAHGGYTAQSRSYRVTGHDGLPIRFSADTAMHAAAAPSLLSQPGSEPMTEQDEKPVLASESATIKIRGHVGRGVLSWDKITRNCVLRLSSLTDTRYDAFPDQLPNQEETDCSFIVLAYSRNKNEVPDDTEETEQNGEPQQAENTGSINEQDSTGEIALTVDREQTSPWTTYSGIGLILHEEEPNWFTRMGTFNFNLISREKVQELTTKVNLSFEQTECGSEHSSLRDIFLF